ncbi:hypothetical protein IE53DRAFT_371375 [Violaceomyces palustris]|uniref:Uncharacterized protein n=1 Tax=Violaceomyces palustris TaxID=1673888 RepID=A0ACD0NNX9_9BASI|nr:hypothetical protein IE53DRAFT_371375 [Violaceomyces palustris]
MVAPTLIDCWHVRDLQRFRAVLKGGANDRSGAGSGAGPYSSSYSHGGVSHSSLGHHHSSGPCPPSEVNRRDHAGRTALHLIASSTEPVSIDYLHALLSHPSINLNLQDAENGWTALHRALYHSNLITALTLLRRPDTDTRLKDFEGLTPFDLYNSTVPGTNPNLDSLGAEPDFSEPGKVATQLFTWGVNRNFCLGLGDGDDRALPDRVILKAPHLQEQPGRQSPTGSVGRKFDRIGVKDIAMSKLHTVVLTDEKSENVWVCGLGGNGRLGQSPQTQPAFEPLKDFKETARCIAVAQDHTIIVTTSGAVYTYGLNRFSQLGYVVEQGLGVVSSSSGAGRGGGAASATFGGGGRVGSSAADLDVQVSPRKIVGPLKKEVVLGAAASKLHSVVFTADALYTWGTNTGQLGYDRGGTPVQVLPRKVTALVAEAGIKQVAATEFGTACLMESWDVIVWHNDSHYRINFPLARFTADISVFRPRQAQPKPSISKLTSSGTTFAALSDMGDLFTFNLEHPSEYASGPGSKSGGQGQAQSRTAALSAVPKPQLVWSVRKKFTAVRDVAIGSDGSIILCTESGHVFVRSRKSDVSFGGNSAKAAGRAFKFQAVPYLQRVVKVATSESGALAAIRSEPSLLEVRPKGRTIEEALRDLLPHLRVQSHTATDADKGITTQVVDLTDNASDIDADASSDDESDAGDDTAARYQHMALLIAEAAKRWDAGRAVATGGQGPNDVNLRSFYGPHNLIPPFGCDAFVVAGGRYLPVHRSIIAARIPSLAPVLSNPSSKGGSMPAGISVKRVGEKVATINIPSCSFSTALFLLHYVYSDDLPPVWTSSVGLSVEKSYKAGKIDRLQVQSQLLELAQSLGLSALEPVLRSPVPRPPVATLRADMLRMFETQVDVEPSQSPLRDVEIAFKDRTIPAHSPILRRSPFFAALFQPRWTSSRWESNVITIDMKHLRWEVARIVLLHLYVDGGLSTFDGIDEDKTMDQYMDFLIEVLAASNELLLDKLKLLCCVLLRRRVLANNVSAVLTDADFYHALPLKEACLDYCTRTMETLLESGMLDELGHRMLKDLTKYVRNKQDEKMRRTLASDRVLALIEKHREYYDDLDIPEPSLHLVVNKVGKRLKSPGLHPADSSRRMQSFSAGGGVSPLTSPRMKPLGGSSNILNVGPGSDPSMMFSMDEDETPQQGKSPSLNAVQATSSSRSASSSTTSSPWSILPKVAHMSLDDQPGRGDRTPAPWRGKSVETEKAATASSRDAKSSESATSPPPTPSGSSGLRGIMAAEREREQQARRGVVRSTPGLSPAGSGATTPVKSTTSTSNLEMIPLTISAKLSQKDRKRQKAAAAAAALTTPPEASPALSASSHSATPSPWKLPERVQSSIRAQNGNLADSPTAMATSFSSLAKALVSSTSPPLANVLSSPPGPTLASLASTSSNSNNNHPMGPTYTPTRIQGQRSLLSQKRVSSSGEAPAWSHPNVVSPNHLASSSTSGHFHITMTRRSSTSSSSSSSSSFSSSPPTNKANSTLTAAANMSRTSSAGSFLNTRNIPNPSPSSSHREPKPLTFAQIQQQQLLLDLETKAEEEAKVKSKKKSFAEILEEERLEEERSNREKKQAEEFERWFEEESRRVREAQGKVKGKKKASRNVVEQKEGGEERKGSGGKAKVPPPRSSNERKKRDVEREKPKPTRRKASRKGGEAEEGKVDEKKPNPSTNSSSSPPIVISLNPNSAVFQPRFVDKHA